MRILNPMPWHRGFPGGDRAGRILAFRDTQGRLRQVPAASTLDGAQKPARHDPLMRDLALLIALKKKKH